MNKKLRNFLKIGLGATLLASSLTAFADNQFDDLNQNEIVAAMGAGWNLGNTLEAHSNGTPNDSAWGNPIDPVTTPELMKLVKNSGFNTIRIPVSYLKYIGPAPDYKIDENWLKKVKKVVDMALAEDLYVITNIHGDGYNSVAGAWLLCNGSNQTEIKAKYKAFWTQIATLFKDYDEHLIFESMNEVFDNTYEWQGISPYPNPNYYSNINDYNQIFVDAVRPTSLNNAKRWLLIPGWNTDIDMTSESKGFKIPNDTYLDRSVSGKRLMISVHYYAPWDLCGDETDSNVSRWGDEAWNKSSNKCTHYGMENNSENAMVGQFDKLKNWFTSKGYPVIVGEYGTVDKSAYDNESPTYTAYWTKTLCENARRVGAVPVLWDNGHVSTDRGFATINRKTNTLARPYIVQAINEAFDQEIEIDTTTTPDKEEPTTPDKKFELITNYVVNVTVNGAKTAPSYTVQYAGWDQVTKTIPTNAQNLDIDLSPSGTKDGFTNLGYLTYTDSLYTVTVNKITINGYEFTSPLFAKQLTATQKGNGLPNIWSNNDGEYLSDNGKAILSITGTAISLYLKNDESTSVKPVEVGATIVSVENGIILLGAQGKSIEVYNTLGSCVQRMMANDYFSSLQLNKGIYIVKIGDNKPAKVIVK